MALFQYCLKTNLIIRIRMISKLYKVFLLLSFNSFKELNKIFKLIGLKLFRTNRMKKKRLILNEIAFDLFDF